MSTRRLIAPFWNRKWLILTTTLTVIAGTLWWAQGLPQVYESTVVLAANSDDGNSLPQGQGVRLRQELWSESVINPVIQSDLFKDQRASGATREALVEKLRAGTSLIDDHQGTSVVVHLYYRDRMPERVETIANVLGQAIESAELKRDSGNDAVFRLVQSASPAIGPIKPRRFVVTVFALGGGLLLGLMIAALSELIHTRRQEEFHSPSVRTT